MNLKINQETKPVTGSNWLVAAIYDPDAPSVIIDSYAFPKPYTGQTQLVSFNGVDDMVYTYICWESATTSPGGTSRNNFEIQPSNNEFNVREDLFLVADVSPYFASNTNFYGADPSLPGWDWYFERIPLGTQQPDVDYSKTKDASVVAIGDTTANGLKLLASGDVFGVNEKAVIHFYPQVAVTTSTPTAKLVSSTEILKVSTTLDNTASGKSFLLQGTAGYFEITLPDATTVPNNKPIFFLSSGGSHINVGIATQGGQLYQWTGGSTTKLILGQDEQMMIYPWEFPDSTTRWLVAQISWGVLMVGEVLFGYNKNQKNTIPLDGSQGLSRTTYSRLWNVINNLEGACKVTAASWSHSIGPFDGVTYNDNMGKFSLGDGSTTFGVPRLYEYGFTRIVDGSTEFAGRLEAQQFPDHSHPTSSGIISSGDNGYGPSRLVGRYDGGQTNHSDLTAGPYNRPGPLNNGTQLSRIGAENRPDNIGLYAFIRI